MPAVAAPAVLAALAIEATATALIITEVAIGAALTAGLTVAANALKPDDKPKSAQEASGGRGGQQTIRQALPSRFRVYGRDKIAGALHFFDATATGRLAIGKVLNCAQSDRIEEIWLDDQQYLVWNGSAYVDGPGSTAAWRAHITVELKHGEPAQTAAFSLTTLFPTLWTTDHRLQGLTHAVITYQDTKAEEFADTYPGGGAPNLTAVLRRVRCFDTRTGGHSVSDPTTWAWRDNAALCIAEFLISKDGWGLDPSVIDWSNITAQANVCDQAVALAAGGTEPRYRIWGRYSLDEERRTVLTEMLRSCGGRLLQGPDGKVRLFVGRTVTPTVTLGDDDILEADLYEGGDPIDRVGSVKPRIVYGPYGYQETEVPAAESDDGDARFEAVSMDLPLRFCPSPAQAQRIAKAALQEANDGWRGTLTTTIAGLQAYGQEVIRVQLSEFELDEVMLVESISLDIPTMTVRLGVRSAPDWSWSTSDEQALPPRPDLLPKYSVPLPTGIFGNVDRSEFWEVGSSNKITMQWSGPTDPAYTFQAQWRKAASPLVTTGRMSMGSVGVNAAQAVDNGSSSDDYDVRIRTISPGGGHSE